MPAPTVLITTPSIVLATPEEAVLISYWRKTPSLIDTMRVGEVLDRFAIQAPRPILQLVVLDACVGIPDEEVRQRVNRKVQQRELKTAATVVVFEGSGFIAAALRSVVTAIQLAQRHPTPMHVVGSVRDAAALCNRKGWSTISPATLSAHVDALRALPQASSRDASR